MSHVVFVDRDGVINKSARPHEYVTTWDKFVFLENVPEAIKLLNDEGYIVVVVTNQRCVALGVASTVDVESLHAHLREYLITKGARIDFIFYCPHDLGECECRKPKIGLFLRVESFVSIDKDNSFMIGDDITDIQAGKAYGVRTIGIGPRAIGADYNCPSLYDAARMIIEVKKGVR